MKPEVRAKLECYQTEAARALADHFLCGSRPGSGDVLLDSLRSLVLLRESQLDLERKNAATAQLAGEAKQLAQAAFDRAESNFGYYSVLGFLRRRGREFTVDEASRHGKNLTRICRERGIEVCQQSDPRFGVVNTYPESVLEQYFAGTESE